LRKLDEGSFGQIYKCKDLSNPELPLVIKLDKDIKQFSKEISALNKINS
jgi:hypothetical protein